MLNSSIFYILGKSRSESAHSAFLAWLLKGDNLSNNDQAMKLLLQLLAKRATNNQLSEETRILLSNPSSRFEIQDVSTEKVVSQLSKINSNDRIDIFVALSIEGKRIDIIIENKIGSTQGKEKNSCAYTEKEREYNNKKQTERYHYAISCHPLCGRKNVESVFVYLESGYDDDVHESFIRINYQMILDDILEKIALDECPKTKRIVNDYILTLTRSYDNDPISASCTIMAVRNKEREGFIKKWEEIYKTTKCDIYNPVVPLREMYMYANAAKTSDSKYVVEAASEWIVKLHNKNTDRLNVYCNDGKTWEKQTHNEAAKHIIEYLLQKMQKEQVLFLLQKICGKGSLIRTSDEMEGLSGSGFMQINYDDTLYYIKKGWDVISNKQLGNLLQLIYLAKEFVRVEKYDVNN